MYWSPPSWGPGYHLKLAIAWVTRHNAAHTQTMTILPASARFVVPASTAAASKLVLFDVMDTIVADPFFRGFHKVARLEARARLVRADPRFNGFQYRAFCTLCAFCCPGPLRPRLGQGALRDQMPRLLRRLRVRRD